MIYRIDLHVHTSSSGDNNADLEEVIEAAIRKGLEGLAITEHYTFGASEPVEALRERYHGRITLYRGVEFSAREGHCLVFGADTDRMAMKYAPVRELVRAVTEAGGVVIPTHPYRGANSMGDIVLDLPGIAGIEGCNGANLHAMNMRAMEAAAGRKLPFTGGSDAHAPAEVGSCYTEFDELVTPETFVDRLRSGRFTGRDTRKVSRIGFPY